MYIYAIANTSITIFQQKLTVRQSDKKQVSLKRNGGWSGPSQSGGSPRSRTQLHSHSNGRSNTSLGKKLRGWLIQLRHYVLKHLDV